MRYKDHMATSWSCSRRDIHDEIIELFESVYHRRDEGVVLINERRAVAFEPFIEKNGRYFINLFGEFNVELNSSDVNQINIAHSGINMDQSEKIAFVLEGPDVIGHVTYFDEEGMKIYEERKKLKKKAYPILKSALDD